MHEKVTVHRIARSLNIDEDKFDPMFLSPTMFKVPVSLFKTGIKSNVTICFSLPNLILPKLSTCYIGISTCCIGEGIFRYFKFGAIFIVIRIARVISGTY